jgi:hypothetical protein
VHLPALGQFFRSDDFLHLYRIADRGYLRFALTPHAGHLLITSHTVFYLCHALFGVWAAGYHGVALLTHLVNVLLLFRLVEVSSGRRGLALVAALLWGMSGLHQEPIAWHSAHGHSLVTTFALWFLLDLARLARDRREPSWGAVARWYALLMAAATSWGTGIAVATLAGPVAYLLLPRGPRRAPVALCLGTLLAVLPALYLSSSWIHARLEGAPAGALPGSSEVSALLAADPLLALSLLARMVCFGVASPLLGPLVARGPLVGARADLAMGVSIGIAVAALALLGVAARRGPWPARRRLAACLLLALGSYALVAAGRAALYQHLGFPASVAAMVPRYHTLGSALATALLALAAAELPAPRGALQRALAALALLAIGGFDRAASLEVQSWLPTPHARQEYRAAIFAIEEEIASHPPGSDVVLANRYFHGIGYGNERVFPGLAGLFVIAFERNEVEGRRVLFVDGDRERLDAARRLRGTRTSTLLVAPEELQP